MSDRLISVNNLWNAVQKRRNDYGIFAHVIESEIHYLISEQSSPMIVPENKKTGKWIKSWKAIYCSECNSQVDNMSNFCPHCGAKIDSECIL